MITLLTGENDYALTAHIAQLKAEFAGDPERYSASDLSTNQLADMFAGQSLFSRERLILLDDPTGQSELWSNIEQWAGRLGEGTHIVLIEPKPDKRTSSYKWLKKHAVVHEYTSLDDRQLAHWLADYVKQAGAQLSLGQQQLLLRRVGADQWELAHAVDKLALADEVNDELIEDVTTSNVNENVFALFETVLHGDLARLHTSIERLQATEEPYRILALINTQALQLAGLVFAEGNASRLAADVGAKSAYPYQKLASYAARLSAGQVRRMLEQLAASDMRLKTTDASPWLVLEHTLAGLASEFSS